MSKCVLIADDDVIIRSTIATYLGARGLRVMIAQDIIQASMMAMRQNPDLVVLDIRMPGGNGFDVLRRVRNSSNAWIPIIAISADTDPNVPMEAASSGANEFIAKPLNLEQLYNKICELLNISPVITSSETTPGK